MSGACLDPIVVVTFELVAVPQLVRLAELQSGKADDHGVLVIGKDYFPGGVDRQMQDAFFLCRNDLPVIDLQIRECDHGIEDVGLHQARIEEGPSVRAAEDKMTIHRLELMEPVELIAGQAMAGEEYADMLVIGVE